MCALCQGLQLHSNWQHMHLQDVQDDAVQLHECIDKRLHSILLSCPLRCISQTAVAGNSAYEYMHMLV